MILWETMRRSFTRYRPPAISRLDPDDLPAKLRRAGAL